MLKIHVLTVKTCSPEEHKDKLFRIIESKFANKLSRISIREDTIKVFFHSYISFEDIDELAGILQRLERISVKEMKWRYQKLNGKTYFLDMVVS